MKAEPACPEFDVWHRCHFEQLNGSQKIQVLTLPVVAEPVPASTVEKPVKLEGEGLSEQMMAILKGELMDLNNKLAIAEELTTLHEASTWELVEQLISLAHSVLPYTHYFCFSITFSTLLIHHHTPCQHNLPCTMHHLHFIGVTSLI